MVALGETSIIISIVTLIGVLFDKIRKSRCVRVHSSCCCCDLDLEREIEDEQKDPDSPVV